MADLGSLTAKVIVDPAGFKTGLAGVEKDATKWSQQMQGILSFGGGILPGLAGIASIGGAFSTILNAAKDIDAVADRAENLGVSVEKLSGLFGVLQADDVPDAEAALKKLAKELVSLDDKSRAAFASFGLNADALRSMDTVDAFRMIARTWGQMDSATRRSELSLLAFSKAGLEVQHVLAELAKDPDKAANAISESMVESSENILRAEKTAKDLWTTLKRGAMEGAGAFLGFFDPGKIDKMFPPNILHPKAAPAEPDAVAEKQVAAMDKFKDSISKATAELETQRKTLGMHAEEAKVYKAFTDALNAGIPIRDAQDLIAPMEREAKALRIATDEMEKQKKATEELAAERKRLADEDDRIAQQVRGEAEAFKPFSGFAKAMEEISNAVVAPLDRKLAGASKLLDLEKQLGMDKAPALPSVMSRGTSAEVSFRTQAENQARTGEVTAQERVNRTLDAIKQLEARQVEQMQLIARALNNRRDINVSL